MPSSYIGFFTPPKDHGNGGSCRAFGTIDDAETAIHKATVVAPGFVDSNGVIHASVGEPDLSEQYVLSCNPWRWSCSGGNDALAFLVAPSSGAMNDSCFPYQAKNLRCKYRSSTTWHQLAA